MPGGRPKNSCFDELSFSLGKQNNKYVAICTVCNKKLSNTAASRLKAHRNVCKLVSKSYHAVEADTIELVINDQDSVTCDNIASFSDQNILLIEDPTNAEQEQMNEAISQGGECQSARIFSPEPPPRNVILFNPPSTSSLISTKSSSSSSLNVSRMQSPSASSSNLSSASSQDLHSSKCRKKESSIYKYMDTLSIKEEEEITEALATFIFGCNLPLSIVESQYFKKFIKKIRPSYHEKIPNRKRLSSTLLDKAFENCVESNKKKIGKDSVLLIDGWKNSSANSKTIVSMIHNAVGEQAFINAWDLSGQTESGEKLADIVYESMDIAKDTYSTEVYAVVSDNANVMLKMGRLSSHVAWHTTCNSHTANLLLKDVVNNELNNTVISIQKEFKKPDFEKMIIEKGGHRVKLACETRWCTYRDSFANFIDNLQYMKLSAADKNAKRLKPAIAKLLFDEEFVADVKESIKIFDPICHLINTCQKKDCSLADAVNLWLNLKLPEKFNDSLDKRKKMAFNVYALTAFYLHPYYDKSKLSNENMEKINIFLFQHLNSKGIEDWDAFRNSRGFFVDLYSKGEMSPVVFWSIAEIKHPDLASLATRFMNLPASTAQIERMFSNWAHVHSPIRNRLTFDRSKKLLNIYYSLRLADEYNYEDDDECI